MYLIILTGNPAIMVLFLLLKTGADVVTHVVEHRGQDALGIEVPTS